MITRRVFVAQGASLGAMAMLGGCGGSDVKDPSAPVTVIDAPPTLTPASGSQSGSPPQNDNGSSYAGRFYPTAAGQDMALVANQIWLFDKSGSDHASASGWILDPNSLSVVGQFTHNISHAATVSYQPDADALLMGNAGDANSIAPRIDLLTSFSSYRAGAFLDWNNSKSTPRISIPLINSAADRSQMLFSDSSLPVTNAVWIDRQTVVAFVATPTLGFRATRLRLGMGTDDLSTSGFGTFQSGSTETEYNGTARVIDRYTSDFTGITQGAKWHNGNLYVGWTTSVSGQEALEVRKLSLRSDGTVAMEADLRWLPTSSAGSILTIETEAVAFHGSELLVTGRRYSDNVQGTYVFAGVG